ncbi:MAG: uroporphyrinogen-III synthase [Verrucomicrobia bacterium]|nr:uroporphyrinogen-III synthase [Verrucomicrobiota bacterium]
MDYSITTMSKAGRKQVLYLGTDPENYRHIAGLVHCPLIQTVPLEIPQHLWDDFPDYSHILFTSKNAVAIFLQALKEKSYTLESKQLVAIGKSTAAKLEQEGYTPHLIASQESQEGVIELLRLQDLRDAYIFYPRSSLARKKLEEYLMERGIRHQICDLYETIFQKPEVLPDLNHFREIIFTSPSTVRSFLAAFGSIPQEKKLTCIGAITEAELKKVQG